jgi:hypothetical protein
MVPAAAVPPPATANTVPAMSTPTAKIAALTRYDSSAGAWQAPQIRARSWRIIYTRRCFTAIVISLRMIRTEPEELDRVVHGGEPGLGGDLLRPLLDHPALHLDAAAADPAGEVVMMGG